MSRIREALSREKIIETLKNIRKIGALRVKISHAHLFHISILALVLLLAFTIRLLPMRWGYYLSEFDPYYQYRLTKDMVQNGFLHWTTWQDTMSWWPWGRNVPRTSFPGLALTAATFYTVLNALGIPMAPAYTPDPLASDPVFNFVVLFPAIMATLTCLVIYFVGKDIGGKETGLFAALFLALSASYIGRTSIGFFDDETVGIFGILLFILFFLRSIEEDKTMRSSALYAAAAGLSLGYLFISWGASRYPVGLSLLFVGVLLLLRRYSPRLLLSYSVTFGLSLFIAANIPYLGFSFLTETTNLAVFGVFVILCAFEISRHIKATRMKTIFALSFLGVSISSFLALSWFGYIRRLETKFMSVLNPFERVLYPLTESVQEHRPAAWGSIYYDLGVGIFFVPAGLFFAVQKPTNRNIFLILFGLTSIYFASSMVRLTLILAPALCLLWALALTRILRPFVTVLLETPTALRRKMRFEAHVGREFSGAFLILIFLLLTFTFVLPSRESQMRGGSLPRVFDQAYVPTTIATSGVPVRPDSPVLDWEDALTWMRYNLPSTAVVASWWDYGYWITAVANKTTLADNATFNWTQIQKIGLLFMSNETQAIQILQDLNKDAHQLGWRNNVSHVAIFTTFDSNGRDLNYGEESKWRWMTKIADGLPGVNIKEEDFGYVDLDQNSATYRQWVWNARGKSTVIYKLMTYAKNTRLGQATVEVSFEYFKLVYYSKGPTAGGINALVAVYEVVYP